MCLKSSEYLLFLHCPMALELWHRLFCVAMIEWVPPRGTMEMLGISFKGFDNQPKEKVLWQVAILSLIWFLWLERNTIIFVDAIWDLIYFFSSLWDLITRPFVDILLYLLLLYWKNICHSKRSYRMDMLNWLTPLVDLVKSNFDGCSLDNPRQLGIKGLMIIQAYYWNLF